VTKSVNFVRGHGLLIAVLIAVLATGLRVAYVARQGAHVGGAELERGARAWAEEGRIARVFSDETGDSAYVSPLYAVILGTAYRLFGPDSQPGAWAQAMIAILATAVNVALLPLIARRTRLSPLAGLLAALVVACSPLNIWVETSGSWEQPLTAVALGLLLLGFVGLHDTNWRSWPRIIAVGILAGVTALLTPTVTTTVAAVMLVELMTQPWDRGRTLRAMTGLVAVAGLVVSPWIVRNYRTFGAFVPMRSGFGIELYLGNNPEANGRSFTVGWDDPNDSTLHLHPFSSKDECNRLIRLGEIEYMREKSRLANHWIVGHPGRFVALTLDRIRMLWFPPPDLWGPSASVRMLKSVAFSLLAAFAWGNLLRLILTRSPYRWLWLAALGSPCLVYTITHVEPRYLYPTFGSIVLMSSDLVLGAVRACSGQVGVHYAPSVES